MALLGRPSEKDTSRERAYRQWFARQHPLALVSLLLSTFSLTHGGVLLLDELAGITLGIVTLTQLKRMREETGSSTPDTAPARSEGDWMAWAAIVVGLISLGCAIVFYFFMKPGR